MNNIQNTYELTTTSEHDDGHKQDHSHTFNVENALPAHCNNVPGDAILLQCKILNVILCGVFFAIVMNIFFIRCRPEQQNTTRSSTMNLDTSTVLTPTADIDTQQDYSRDLNITSTSTGNLDTLQDYAGYLDTSLTPTGDIDTKRDYFGNIDSLQTTTGDSDTSLTPTGDIDTKRDYFGNIDSLQTTTGDSDTSGFNGPSRDVNSIPNMAPESTMYGDQPMTQAYSTPNNTTKQAPFYEYD